MGLFDRFKTPKWKDKNWEVRPESIEELDDREILTDLAVTDDTYGVRIEAARKLLNDVNDENQSLEIYKDNSPSFRQVATEKICDENILTDIAKNDDDVHVRTAAIEKIKDESVLIDLLNDKNVYIR